jgi:hypothetical protein
MPENIKEIGKSLLGHAEKAQTTARGLVTELFPFIYPASKRMSTRAISAFLLEKHQVKISAATIAKALRESDRHVEAFLETIQPAARVVAEAYGLDIYHVLAAKRQFESDVLGRETIPVPEALDSLSQLKDFGEEAFRARDFLKEEWFSYDSLFRSLVLAYLRKVEECPEFPPEESEVGPEPQSEGGEK